MDFTKQIEIKELKNRLAAFKAYWIQPDFNRLKDPE